METLVSEFTYSWKSKIKIIIVIVMNISNIWVVLVKWMIFYIYKIIQKPFLKVIISIFIAPVLLAEEKAEQKLN